MRVLFLQEQPEVLQRLRQPRDVNPGVGGTSYLACQVAHELHQISLARDLGLQIHLGCLGPAPSSFHGIPVVDLEVQINARPWDVVISTGGHLDRLASGRIRVAHQRLIAWIHHPFDADKLRKARALGAEVLSIGKAQYLSNVLLAGEHHHIDNLFCAERIRRAAGWSSGLGMPPPKPAPAGKLTVGYMGGLIPSKGFHLLAEQWPGIRRSLEALGIEARLEVIGGSGLYRFDQGHPELPCDQAYGDRLIALLGTERHHSVRFHGTLGDERYKLMSDCDLAVVNPDGTGEAFPATVLEWLSLGVPVISSERYGCADAMRLLPALSIDHPNQIGEKVLRLAQDNPVERQRLAQHCARIGSVFSSQQPQIIEQWLLLLLNRSEPGLYVHNHLSNRGYRLLVMAYLRHRVQALRQWLKRTLQLP